jgi:MFS family permease
LGGAVIALTGIGGAFAAQAVIYAVGLVVLVPLVLPPPTPRLRGSTAIGELREGFAFIAHTRGIQVLIVLLVLTGVFMVGPSGALIPQIAKDELGSDALEASLLFAVLGVGSLLTSLLLATLGDVPNKGGLFIAALIFGSLVFAGIGLSGEYALTMFFMFAWGLCGGFFINMNQTLIQAHTPAEIMGRVMSIHTLAFMGIGPMGALWAGVMADWIGAPQWMAFCGFFLSGLAILSILTQPSLRTMR